MSAPAWRFFRAGGVDQVSLTRGEELGSLDELDQKLWVALSCPVKGTALEPRGLSLLDGDKDGRVRAPELIAAGKWAASVLRDKDELVRKEPGLAIAALDESADEGKRLLDTARALLRSVGKADAARITLDDARKGRDAFLKEAANGDGIVPASAAPDEERKLALLDILGVTAEPKSDGGGVPGLDRASLEAFQQAARERLSWLESGTAEDKRPLGDDSGAAFAALDAVSAKIDDFFVRARIAAFDARALDAMNRDAAAYATLSERQLAAAAGDLEEFPLARVSLPPTLPLGHGVNPAFHERVLAFRDKVVTPLLGARESIGEDEWREIGQRFDAHRSWRAAEVGKELAKLDEARLRELSSDAVTAALLALVDADEEAKPQADAIESVEKLVWLSDNLLTLANNYVAFRDFYSREALATFQAGTLYLDQRACQLCLEVLDPARHAALGASSKAYLVYCDLKNASGDKRSIVAAVTDGDVDNIVVGRNGLFYDRDGRDWDATITRIVDNPISIRQAFWSPYKKALRFFEEQMSKRAAAAEAAADKRLSSAATTATDAVTAAAPPAPAATTAPKKLDVGVVAALGVAVGGITAALGMLLEAFFGLGWLMPLGALGLLFAISGPSMAVAWLKLRQRNLGPLLDANGWAVNAMARVNVPLGRSLTSIARIPDGASRDLRDPYRQKSQPVWAYAVVAVLLAGAIGWYVGSLDRLLPLAARSTTVLGTAAPAFVPPASTPDAKPAPAPAAK